MNNLIKFTAEASVYKTCQSYCGYSGTGDLSNFAVTPATNCTSSSTPAGCTDDCTTSCFFWRCWVSSCRRTCCKQVSPDQILCGQETFDGPCPAVQPPPPPPKPCPNGQRCCGSVSDGTCIGQCWPNNQPCP